MPAAASPYDEVERLHALQEYGVLDTPREATFDELAALAASICRTPFALVSFIDRDRLLFKAHHGLSLTGMPREESFCTHVVGRADELLIVPDATRDPRFAGIPLVTGELGVRFYAGAPLGTSDGHALGTLCVIDREPRTLDPEEQEALRVLGRQVMAQLELRRGLRESILNEARLENSQRIAGLGDWEYDFANRRLRWSEEVYRILALSRKDTPADAEAFYSRVHPDDLALVHREKKAAAAGTRRVEFEHRIVRPDGEVRHIHQVTEIVVDAQGEPVRESGTIQDISERKRAEGDLRQSEERFKLVARAVSDVIWDWNLASGDLWWSDGFVKVFGYLAGEIGTGIEAWTDRIHPGERDRVVVGVHHAIDTGAESWVAEYRFRCANGSYAYVQDNGYILRDPTGKGIRMVGGMRDLTERKNLETQYLRAQRMESIGTLAGGIAHDLNNVLAQILMAIEVLRLDSGNGPDRATILDTIHASCRRGADLVRQVLSFARGIDSPRIPIQPRKLIDDLTGFMRETFPRNIQIVTEVPAALWPIAGEPTQLHQVLLNLAVNARDAMPRGGTLTMAAVNTTLAARSAGPSREAGIGRHVLIEVSDTGSGIPPEIRSHIFEPFFTTKEVGKGTGLGLATVQTVVKSHGGFLSVESRMGRGTTFKIYLPADPALQTEDAEPVPEADLPRGRDELVLVVDDELSIRHIMQQTLEAFGYRVVTAGDGAEAVALYSPQAREIAVVLIDMVMPIMDGAATIQVLRHINPAVRIIAASGLGVGENAANSAASGVQGFLPKPYTAEALLGLLREVLDRPAATP